MLRHKTFSSGVSTLEDDLLVNITIILTIVYVSII